MKLYYVLQNTESKQGGKQINMFLIIYALILYTMCVCACVKKEIHCLYHSKVLYFYIAQAEDI